MNRISTIIVVISLLSFLAACASSGNPSLRDENQATVSKKLTKGMRQSKVRSFYGDPVKVAFTDSGNEIWTYSFTKMQSKVTNFIPYVNLVHSGATGTKKELVIFFNREKLLMKYTVSESAVETSTGLIN